MDLIYKNVDNLELGILKYFSLDFEENVENSKNTFEIQTPLSINPLSIGYSFYEEGTEIGGIVDSIKIDTKKNVATLGGRTWRGLLGSKILEPPTGQAYYTVSGGLKTVLRSIISKVGLSDLFTVGTVPTKSVSYQFNRYTDAYTGIIKLLAKYGLKLQLASSQNGVELTAVAITDHSQEEELTSDKFDFVIKKNNPKCNHMIGLGSGELENRLVVHKYLQADGSIGNTPYFTGVDEVTMTFDYPNSESADDLESKTVEALNKKVVEDAIDITSYDLQADIGDKFKALDMYSGLSVEQYVIQKIIKINDTVTKTTYEVGERI